MREVIASQLLAPRKPSTLNPNPEAQKVLSEAESPVRLDYMFLYHTRLWKRPQLNLKEVYASILSLTHEHKLTVGEFPACVPSQGTVAKDRGLSFTLCQRLPSDH